MGFYIRKSISVGPLRFNLSKSGIGVSAGIKGFRIGSGPRGNYVHMGRGGLYFRQTLSNGEGRSHQTNPNELASNNIRLSEIESADVGNMVNSSSIELLEEINRKGKIMVSWPFVFLVTCF